MKIPAIAFAFSALTAFAAPPGAIQVTQAVTERDVVVEKISPAVVPTPQFQVLGTPPKRMTPANWFEIEVEFAVKNVDLVGELTLEYTAMINNKLFRGEVTHINIPKGPAHYSVMYISPRNMERITLGKPLNMAMVQEIWVTIKSQGQDRARGTFKTKGAQIPTNIPLENGMLSQKADTPFQVLWWDRYEAVKPANR